MGNFEKTLCLQAYCDKQINCLECLIRNMDGKYSCNQCIDDWEEEKIDRAYKIVFGEKEPLKGFLTDRRVVELRNGERYLIVGDFFMGENNYFIKGDFTDDLANHGLRKFDIVRTYEEIPKIGALYYKELGIIWERKPKKMTKKEIEEALGYEIEIVESE